MGTTPEPVSISTSWLIHFLPVTLCRKWPTGPSAVMLVVSPEGTWRRSTVKPGCSFGESAGSGAGHARRTGEEDVADVDRQARMLVQVRGEERDLRIDAPAVVRRAAVAVELDVRQVGAMAVQRLQGLQRRPGVAGESQIQTMQV